MLAKGVKEEFQWKNVKHQYIAVNAGEYFVLQ